MKQKSRTQNTSIGILTVEDQERSFKGNRKNFVDIIRTGRKMNVDIHIITCGDLRLDGKKMPAYTYDFQQKAWIKEKIPLPIVIYNRIPSREDETDTAVKSKIRQCLNHPQLHFFNPYFFNKWSLMKWLKSSKTTRKWLPKTSRLDAEDFANWLKQYRLIYLKPERGKAGKGIMRIQVQPEQYPPYYLTVQEEQSGSTRTFMEVPALWRAVVEATNGEKYILQQGIDLVTANGRPYDLRILVQKDDQGSWQVTGIGARIAGQWSITTHVPRGGSIEDPSKLLSEEFGEKKTLKLMKKIRNSAVAIAKQIEKKSGFTLGEMSIDLGVDKKGHLWFFEANSKPMKFDEPHIRKDSLKRLIQYCLYLAGKGGEAVGGQTSSRDYDAGGGKKR